MPWSALIQEIRAGNESGVEPLYAAISSCARAQLFHSVDPQVVEDHVQEIHMIVLAALRNGELREPNSLMGFVKTVARRQVASHIRYSIVRRRRLVPVDADYAPPVSSSECPEASLFRKERVRAMKRILGLIRERDRELLTRFYFDEQIPAQICQEMRITPKQFRLYKSRALAKCSELSRRGAARTDGRPRVRTQSTKPLRIA
jgi:RNA polymerase sigma factor (sigma-70 family)